MKFHAARLFRCSVLLAAGLLLAAALPAHAQTWYNTPFVITNDSGVNPNDVWISFQGNFTDSGTAQTLGGNTITDFTSTWTSVSLASLETDVSSTIPYFSSSDPTASNYENQFSFSLNDYIGGRIFINYGTTALSGPPLPYDTTITTPYILLEPTINGNDTNNSNMDLSYVDGLSAPATLGVYNSTGVIESLNTVNPIATNPDILQNVAAAAGIPSAAEVYNGTGLIRIISSAAASSQTSNVTLENAYHSWTNLMTTLQTTTATTPLNLSSYYSPTNSTIFVATHMNTTLFGYSGAPVITNQAPGFQYGQSYNSTAVFSTNLNPTSNATLTAAGISPGTAGVVITGYGSNTTNPSDQAGNFSIYIPAANLTATNIYGNNPSYITLVNGTVYEPNAGIVNDLSGRIVGDLLAGMVDGWSNSTVNIVNHAAATGLNLYGTTFSSTTIGGLSSGEYFYLISLASSEGQLGNWTGAAIDPNPDDYDS